jgi:hypothetical protein
MTSKSLREISIDQFRMPPRKEKGDFELDPMVSQQAKNKIRRILDLHNNGFSPEKITALVHCKPSTAVASDLGVEHYTMQRKWMGDNDRMEKSPVERIDEIFNARLRSVIDVIAKYGENSEAIPESNRSTNNHISSSGITTTRSKSTWTASCPNGARIVKS